MRKENLRGMLKDTKATIFKNCVVLLKMSNGKMLREYKFSNFIHSKTEGSLALFLLRNHYNLSTGITTN
jgi:hypothetical protein